MERLIATATLLSIALMPCASAIAAKRERAPAPVSTPGDKRDRVVVAPGSPFHARPYWQAMGQCGGIYFKLGNLYSDAAIKAKVVQPNPTALADFTRKADAASKTASAFFDAAERFLVGDRQMARDEAVLTYDVKASEAGDRLKGIDPAVQAAKPCPALFQVCRGAFPQTCNQNPPLTN